MSKKVGEIGWIDLTVPDAVAIRDFYQAVVGWQAEDVPMGEYADFSMASPADGETRAGICHARGGNAGLPAAWMIYINVADLDASIAACEAGGGEILDGPRDMGDMGRYCFIRDPAGAVCALFEHRVG